MVITIQWIYSSFQINYDQFVLIIFFQFVECVTYLILVSSGKDSLIQRLKKAGIPDPTEYITFHGLRTHSELNGDLVCT